MRREYMTMYRKERHISLQNMAQKLRISKMLLRWLESNDMEVTHPNIAQRIADAYELTYEQYEGLMPEHYRPTSPNYNPNLYKPAPEEYNDFVVMRYWNPGAFK